MVSRANMMLLVLALVPASLQARLQDRPAAGVQQQVSLRVLVEGSQSAVPYFIENLRSTSGEFGMNLVFVASIGGAYDARLVVTEGTGSDWDNNADVTSHHEVFYAYCSTIALAPDGKLLFTVSRGGGSLGSARTAVIRETIKQLGQTALKQNRSASAGAIGAQDQSADQLIEGLSGEPGVYYRSPTEWMRIDPVKSVAAKPKGIALAMLSFGAVPIRAVQVYQGAQASLQTRERKPSFYVRGFAVSNKNALIVQVENKGKNREVRIGTVSPFYAQAGFNERNARKVKITRSSPDVIVITPIDELKPGQYVLLLDVTETDNGYDFDIK